MFGRQIPIHVIDYEGAPAYGVVEYGVATLANGEIVDTHTRLCRAHAPIDPHDIAVHGISYEESLKYSPFHEDYDFFVSLRRCGPLAAHNARYEARLTQQAWAFPPLVPAWHAPGQLASWGPWIDSCALARKLAPGLSRYRLQVVIEELGLSNELDAVALDKCPPGRVMYHAALYDALAAALILKKFIKDSDGNIPEERLFSVRG